MVDQLDLTKSCQPHNKIEMQTGGVIMNIRAPIDPIGPGPSEATRKFPNFSDLILNPRMQGCKDSNNTTMSPGIFAS